MARTPEIILATLSALGTAIGVYSCSTREISGNSPHPQNVRSQPETGTPPQTGPSTEQTGTPPAQSANAWPKPGTLSEEQKAGLELAKERRKARQFVEFLNRSWNGARSQATQPSELQTPEDFLADNAVEIAIIRAHAGMEVYYSSPNPKAEFAPPPSPALAAAGPFRLRTLK